MLGGEVGLSAVAAGSCVADPEQSQQRQSHAQQAGNHINPDRYAGTFSSSYSHPYRYRSTISLPKPVITLGQFLLTATHPQPVFLAAAGIQSPLSQ